MAESCQEAWKKGTLHIIVSAPLQSGSFRMQICPSAPEGGEYIGIVLQWVGDAVFHHAALLKLRNA